MPGTATLDTAAPANEARTLLVVDSDRLVAGVLCDMLRAVGFDGIPCHRAADALALCASGAVRGALVEEEVGTDDGARLVDQLRELFPHLTFGLLHAGPARHRPGELGGLRTELLKPTDLSTLALAARQLVDERHLVAV